MNTFKTGLVVSVLSVAGLTALPANAAPPLAAALPDIHSLTTQVGSWIANQLQGQLSQLLSTPRTSRAPRASSVTIIEGENHMIVTATRLPPKARDVVAADERKLPGQF